MENGIYTVPPPSSGITGWFYLGTSTRRHQTRDTQNCEVRQTSILSFSNTSVKLFSQLLLTIFALLTIFSNCGRGKALVKISATLFLLFILVLSMSTSDSTYSAECLRLAQSRF